MRATRLIDASPSEQAVAIGIGLLAAAHLTAAGWKMAGHGK